MPGMVVQVVCRGWGRLQAGHGPPGTACEPLWLGGLHVPCSERRFSGVLKFPIKSVARRHQVFCSNSSQFAPDLFLLGHVRVYISYL